MNEAVIVFSRKGLFTKVVLAREIQSHEHARKLWPLVTTSHPRQLVTWVKPSFEKDELKRKSHFRTLPGKKNIKIEEHFNQEETDRYTASKESPEHLSAKRLIAEALQRRLTNNIAMPWYFKDEASSDFYLSGDILLGAESITTEKKVKTAFHCEYRLDVAILSKKFTKEPILLGGIEIEWEHQFHGRKALIASSQAFPLISIDISGMKLDEITAEWADYALTVTTHSNTQKNRKTFIYLHDLLYPLYLRLPEGLIKDNRHQFLAFARDEELGKILRWLKKLQNVIDIDSKDMSVSIVHAKSEQSTKMLENAGQVVGDDWSQVNSKKCLMLTIKRPNVLDEKSHIFHIGMANIFLLHTDSLVGYKYMTDIHNNHPNEDVWRHSKWNSDSRNYSYYRILPKRLSEPRSRIIDVLNSLNQSA
ncbi:hypothetical protein [Methylomonas koyamae]|uniref:Uncharacterized protein n=1 Tax=Methylomonas koyamae TaxID=702114 RepID=A0A291II42_9GAMM|nr:hypothetical protein [Methylomonas koyamae]ATG89919.1 hypothetical protein MKLM6_1679 [Methylomonas koyamae]OAI25853.1 hypothetical protein A1356_12405 [Methylomonas koyamae]